MIKKHYILRAKNKSPLLHTELWRPTVGVMALQVYWGWHSSQAASLSQVALHHHSSGHLPLCLVAISKQGANAARDPAAAQPSWYKPGQ
jgi:hypothetical protein